MSMISRMVSSLPSHSYSHSFTLFLIMRLIFLALFIILGANLMIQVLDSNLTDTITERNEALERLLNPPSNVIE